MKKEKDNYCEEVEKLGYEPKHLDKGRGCCGTCHSSFHPDRGFHLVEVASLIVPVCCSMKRSVERGL